MKAKVLKDGDRIVVSFSGIKDAEHFLESIVKMLSEELNQSVAPKAVQDIEPLPNDDLDVDKEVEEPENIDVADFDAPYTGKTPADIMAEPQHKGFYFLCNAVNNGRIPSASREECRKILAEYIDGKGILKPPYGNTDRMKKYIIMAQKMLGEDVVSNVAYEYDDAEYLTAACDTTLDYLKEFRSKL